jgi:hypothetical protein
VPASIEPWLKKMLMVNNLSNIEYTPKNCDEFIFLGGWWRILSANLGLICKTINQGLPRVNHRPKIPLPKALEDGPLHLPIIQRRKHLG